MDQEKQHIRHCILYAFNRGLSGAAAAREICDTYGGQATTESTCNRWFAKFRTGDTTLTDWPRERRPSTIDDEALETLIKEDSRKTTRELAQDLGTSHTTIENHLHLLGKVQKLGTWLPHNLSIDNKMQRVTICSALLSRNNNERFLNRIVTGDEKWVLYVNVRRKRQWLNASEQALPKAKADLHQKKVMLCVWWDNKGILYFELLPNNLTINAEVYASQLQHLQDSLVKKRPALVNRKGVILLHDNARPHVAKMIKEKIQELSWEVLAHPAYSPDIAPSDYHLFRSLQNFLANKHYDKYEDLKMDIEKFFDQKPPNFYEREINQLPLRWAKVVDSNGDYIID